MLGIGLRRSESDHLTEQPISVICVDGNLAHPLAPKLIVKQGERVTQRNPRSPPVVFWSFLDRDLVHIEDAVQHLSYGPDQKSIIEVTQNA